MNINEIRAAIEYVAAEVKNIHERHPGDVLPADEQVRFDDGLAFIAEHREVVANAEAREAKMVELRKLDLSATPGSPAPFQIRRETAADIDARSAPIGEVRDAARKLLDGADWAPDANRVAVERALVKRSGNFDGDAVARRLVATESDAYRSGWLKVSTGRQYELSASENDAIARAQSLATGTAGGLGVPVIIDPTILLTSGLGHLGILSLARIEAITNNEWKGVTSAGTDWSFDSEAAEVSDDAVEIAQPTVPAEMARGFIPFSIEIAGDYPNFASEMSKVLVEGYERLLAETLAVGSGSPPVPTGVFTGVNNVTNSRVALTAAGTFAAGDIDKVWAALPEKFRDRASWFMSVDINNRIRALSAGDNHNRFTVDQTAEGAYVLNGKRVVLSDYAPTYVGATAGTVRNILVAGDFESFLVAQRVGMTVEYVPHLFGTTNGRPTGQRGWFAHARVGSGVVVPNGLRVLRNT